MRKLSPLEVALSYYGTTEAYGDKSNAVILKWINAQMPWVVDDSKSAWCGAFMAACFDEAGMKQHIPDTPQVAINWMKVGEKVNPIERRVGDLIIFWRVTAEDWRSHVAFYINDGQEGMFRCLGGNQSNQVNIAQRPSYKMRGVRRVF